MLFPEIKKFPIFPLCLIFVISFFGIGVLFFSNSGNFSPWCVNQIIRLGIGTVFLFFGFFTPISFWKKSAYLFYFIGIILLIVVILIGKISMGAQRWISMSTFNFQPSELMKLGFILAIAKYLSNKTIEEIKSTIHLIPAIVLLSLPMGLVLLQPDLGTAMVFLLVFVAMLFVCGVQIWKFGVTMLGGVALVPILWNFLYDYQKNRILMFLAPEKDPSGAGYHIIQSKIALGSGGLWGKGLLNGTQCQLNFLPEKQTDFVFSALGEELGFIGCISLIVLYVILITYNNIIAMRQRNKFSKILVFGINAMLFFYVFINISMVCGMLPVVGIPLPFFSYGGSSLVVLMFCQGIIFSTITGESKYELYRV